MFVWVAAAQCGGSNANMTADAQKNDSTDLALTQRIRKQVMADKSLSAGKHHVVDELNVAPSTS
jgi:hypothetical protein